ncbi:hypothetical protein [Urbifossiella limnaea]|uniref:Uncharacterized protein n=1 Tax=Urbifossiella limnaea TaxID=2528023 RepID=A0A517XZR5_9BACT|nr:hypothetical protein [Urbifossiella limnaea]QDU22948.1 hypothetical protein ETAA1_49370 [Urbifossiella limnaea]
MPAYAIVFGALLTALGAVAYFNPDLLAGGKPNQISAASPAFVGLPIALAGLLSLAAPGARKHAMHLAAVLALLGVIGGFVPVVLRKFDVNTTAVQVGLGMTGLSAVFLFLCVRSFVAARKARQAGTPTA